MARVETDTKICINNRQSLVKQIKDSKAADSIFDQSWANVKYIKHKQENSTHANAGFRATTSYLDMLRLYVANGSNYFGCKYQSEVTFDRILYLNLIKLLID